MDRQCFLTGSYEGGIKANIQNNIAIFSTSLEYREKNKTLKKESFLKRRKNKDVTKC